MIYSLFIINKAGSMVFHQSFVTFQQEQRSSSDAGLSNSSLRMASTFHALHAMSQSFDPTSSKAVSSGISTIEAGSFRLECLRTLTGTKFFVVAGAEDSNGLKGLLRQVYTLYTDYVLKNPFFIPEQPISKTCELFSRHLAATINDFDSTGKIN